MLELTLNEQKQINGGSYTVYVYKNGSLMKTVPGFYSRQQAQACVDMYTNLGYTAKIR